MHHFEEHNIRGMKTTLKMAEEFISLGDKHLAQILAGDVRDNKANTVDQVSIELMDWAKEYPSAASSMIALIINRKYDGKKHFTEIKPETIGEQWLHALPLGIELCNPLVTLVIQALSQGLIEHFDQFKSIKKENLQ